MSARVHRSWWQSPGCPYRRCRTRKCGINGKSIQGFAFATWWIFGSPDFLLTNEYGVRSTWSTLADAQTVQASSGAPDDYSATCDGRQQPRPGAIYSAVGHLNYGVGLDLRADISIPGACEVNLPIDVSGVLKARLYG